MKRKLSLILATVLLLGLTACGETSNKVPETTTLVTETELVEVELLKEHRYYYTDDTARVKEIETLEYDENGWETGSCTKNADGQVVGLSERTWNEDGTIKVEGWRNLDDYGYVTLQIEQVIDLEGGKCSLVMIKEGDLVTSAQVIAVSPEADQINLGQLTSDQYQNWDSKSAGWQYRRDEEGNLLCTINQNTENGNVQCELEYRKTGGLLRHELIRNGEVEYFEENTYNSAGLIASKQTINDITVYSYDGKGRLIRRESNSYVEEYQYNDENNTGERIYWAISGGPDKGRIYKNEYVYDYYGNLIVDHSYTYYYDGAYQDIPIEMGSTRYIYDENNVLKKAVYSDIVGGGWEKEYDSRGNLLYELQKNTYGDDHYVTAPQEYIYMTVIVTGDAAEKYHADK